MERGDQSEDEGVIGQQDSDSAWRELARGVTAPAIYWLYGSQYPSKSQVLREEADALRGHLNKLKTGLAMGDQDTRQQDKLDRKRFLEAFPRVKWELEELIGKLHALADKVDKLQRKRTVLCMAASSAALTGTLATCGLTLAPMTAGLSLTFVSAMLALGATVLVTSGSTSIMEHRSTSAAETTAGHLVSTGINEEEGFTEALHKNTPQIVSPKRKFTRAEKDTGKNVHAIKPVKANPRLTARAKSFMTTGQVLVQGDEEVRGAFGGTALAVTKGARIMGAAAAGVFLLMDVASLLKEAKQLLDGAKTVSAERLRLQTQELEKKLEELTRMCEILQEGPTHHCQSIAVSRDT
ncbi:apolipoprotein L2-like [Hippopotamus amphibius kiboko]|uniref:apolipoprotein L2-like n=1 Tax=Hippopotamus amphibius kiboko TaxID=575201 RepID=UPI002594FA88|nr:apolipoprotein L2-like [Hippopotamus amphibius kiboko]